MGMGTHNENGFNIDNAVKYHYGKFPPQSIDYSKLLPELVKATDALARFDQMLRSMHNSEIFLTPLRNQEAVISSRMEGTVSTMDEIMKYEADFEENHNENLTIRSEVIETLLYQRALRTAQKKMEEGQPLSQFLVRAAHSTLLSYGRGAAKSPGEYKKEQNFLADKFKKSILFIPISPEKLQEGMDTLFTYIEKSDHVPLIKAAIAHIEFEALHPFKDGNGRIGRMLITLMLWSHEVISAPHFYISAYFEENKDAYIDAMRNVSENDDWTQWCIFFLKAVTQQATRNLQIAISIQELYEEMKQKFSDILSSKYSVNALDFVFTNPVFRNSKFTSDKIPFATASRFTRMLLDGGLLNVVEESSGRRSAMYSFEPLMKLVRV